MVSACYRHTVGSRVVEARLVGKDAHRVWESRGQVRVTLAAQPVLQPEGDGGPRGRLSSSTSVNNRPTDREDE